MNEIVTNTVPPASDTEAPGAKDDNALAEKPVTTSQKPGLMGKLGGLFRNRNGSSLRDDLTDALADKPHTDGTFSPEERAMLNNILRLREVRVEDVMVPRAEIEAAELSVTLGDLLNLFEKTGHSRMPVYVETLDDPRGMIHIRDAMAHITKQSRQASRRGRSSKTVSTGFDMAKVDLTKTIGELNLKRPVLFVPPSMLASDLMARMQAARVQMALVIDEYGGTDGLVSLEDLVEIVVGDIEDEHDDDEVMIAADGDGVYIADARAEIEDVAELIGKNFDAGDHEEDADTIGGLIFSALGRVPARGEVVNAIPGFEFHIADADPRRIKKVRIVETRSADRRRRDARHTA